MWSIMLLVASAAADPVDAEVDDGVADCFVDGFERDGDEDVQD